MTPYDLCEQKFGQFWNNGRDIGADNQSLWPKTQTEVKDISQILSKIDEKQ